MAEDDYKVSDNIFDGNYAITRGYHSKLKYYGVNSLRDPIY